MPYSTMTSPAVFDTDAFIATALRSCSDDYSLNPVSVFTEKYINEIGFDTETEKSILKDLRATACADSPVWNQSLYSYLLNKFEYALDDCYDSDADTDNED
jgi:hypothetical protein